MRKNFFVGILACIMLFSTGCDGGVSKNKLFERDVEIWSVYSNEKIMQNRTDLYSDIKETAALKILAAKNEYESGQLIITPSKEVKFYDVILEDLISSSGVKFAKENIDVYNQKYIEITAVSNEYLTADAKPPIGWYPDALLPFSNAKKYGENVIRSGQNQGLTFDIFVPSTTVAGVYSGSLTLDFKDFKKSIPVELTVADYTISEVTHSKSIFYHDRMLGWGELDSTQHMLDKYTDALSKYRLSPWRLLNEEGWLFNESDIPYFVEKAYKYASQDRNSTLSLPFREMVDSSTGLLTIDKNILKKTLDALIAKSIETKYNLLEKATMYITLIDEPGVDEFGAAKFVPGVVGAFRQALKETADKLKADSSIPSSQLKSDIEAAVRAIPNVVTSEYNLKFKDYIDTWCPLVKDYETQSARNHYTEDEKWWYTAIGPRAPYPNYHIENNLDHGRVLSWMAAKYNVTGNLYWSSNMYAKLVDGAYQSLEDYYADANRFGPSNGDGVLLYPGKRYGIDGPVATNRIFSIRDGNEEYEIFYDIKEQYKKISENAGFAFTSDTILDTLYEEIFDGTSMKTTRDRFISCRKKLLDLATLLESEAKMCVVDFKVSDGEAIAKIAVKTGHTPYLNGKQLIDFETFGSNESTINVYTASQTITEGANVMAIGVMQDGAIKNIEFNLGGGVTVVSAQEFKPFATVNSGTIGLSDAKLELNFAKAESNVTQSVAISHNIVKLLNVNASKLTIELHNPAQTDLKYTILFEYEGTTLLNTISSGIIPANSSMDAEVKNIFGYNWKVAKVKSIHIRFGGRGDDSRTVQMGNIYLYSV